MLRLHSKHSAQRKKHKRLLEQAERNVLAVRGSFDAPGFEACVKAEMESLLAKGTATNDA